jgi:hypothetical protein
MFEKVVGRLNTDSYKFKETNMNYQNAYNRLVENAKARIELSGYKERHHILPRSLGGLDTSENLVDLTAREHFIAHLLLAKMYGGKMIHAVYMMSTRNGYTNRTYEKMRLEFIDGIKNNKERSAKISQSLKGRPKSEEHKEAYRQSRLASGGWVVSQDHKRKVSEKMSGNGNPMWGQTHTEEARKIISEANKQQVSCPHCGTTGAIAIMGRWHFDNCKSAPNPKERKKYPKKVCPHCGKEGGGAQMIANHFDNCRKRLTQ